MAAGSEALECVLSVRTRVWQFACPLATLKTVRHPTRSTFGFWVYFRAHAPLDDQRNTRRTGKKSQKTKRDAFLMCRQPGPPIRGPSKTGTGFSATSGRQEYSIGHEGEGSPRQNTGFDPSVRAQKQTRAGEEFRRPRDAVKLPVRQLCNWVELMQRASGTRSADHLQQTRTHQNDSRAEHEEVLQVGNHWPGAFFLHIESKIKTAVNDPSAQKK